MHRLEFPGQHNAHNDKVDSEGVINLDADTPTTTCVRNDSPRDKKRRKLEAEKERVEKDVAFLQTVKDDSPLDMEDYIKAKEKHRELRNKLASLDA